MNIQTSKKLGILGILIIFLDAILAVLKIIPSLSNITFYNIPRIIGIIIILISLYHLSNIYQTKTIYTNARIGAIVAISGIIIDVLCGIILTPIMKNTAAIITLTVSLLNFVMLAVFFIIAAFFVRRSLNELATRSDINDFATAGQTLFIGAALTIIIFGIIIMGIALLILLNAFSELKNLEPTPPTTIELTATPSQITTNTETKTYCPYCGKPILPENVFCPHCGKQHT